MTLPFRYDDLAGRFTAVRAWAKASFADFNRCAICMSYTLRLSPSRQDGDACLGDLAGAEPRLQGAAALEGLPQKQAGQLLFIRAAELLPRVQRAFGRADVEGPGRQIWPQVLGRKGIIYIENCYPTDSDKRWTVRGVYEPTSGDHWDLFDGLQMVAEEQWIRNNSHPGQMYFWAARDGR